MCRCGIDKRVRTPICRRCRGCESCGCKCNQLDKAKPKSVRCPHCGALPGKPCIGRVEHQARFDAAVREARNKLFAQAKAGRA